MNIFETSLLIISILGVTYAFIKIFGQGKLTEHKIWLGLLLFLFLYSIAFNVLFWSEVNPTLLTQLRFSHMFPMALYGPVFYLYIRALVTEKKFGLIDMVHFIPLALFFIQFWGYYILPLEDKTRVMAEGSFREHITTIIPRLDWFFCIVMLFYTVLVYTTYSKKVNKDTDISIWLKASFTIFMGFVLSFYLYYFLVYFDKITTSNDYVITSFMFIFIATTAYFGYQFPNILNGKPIHKIIPFIKYQRTGLSKEFSVELKERLMYLMDTEKPYLNSELRLNDISEMLDVSRNHASQVINEHFGLGFFDFINKYRVNEAERLLESSHMDYTIREIAYESGFNNRVSFYKAFKKITGVTPTEYKEHFLAS